MKKLITAAALISILLLLVFTSCQQVDNFADYRGVNIISDMGFDSGDWAADRTESYYMNFEHPAESISLDTTDMPSGNPGAIYRLEIPNLFPNGDFEDTAAGSAPAGWEEDGSSINEFKVYDSGSGVINNRTLHYSCQSAGDLVNYNLRDATYGLLDGFTQYGTYIFRFAIRTDGTEAAFDFTDSPPAYDSQLLNTSIPWYFSNAAIDVLRDFPTSEQNPVITPATASGTEYFTLGSKNAGASQNIYIDNLRAARTDIDQFIRLSLEAVDSTSTGRLELIDGTYRFSVYIKEDPTNTTTTVNANRTNNRIPANGITLEAVLAEDNTDGTQTNLQTTRYAVNFSSAGMNLTDWTEITMDFLLQWNPSNSSGGSEHLELCIMPTDASGGDQSRDAGSILIGVPSLELLENGS